MIVKTLRWIVLLVATPIILLVNVVVTVPVFGGVWCVSWAIGALGDAEDQTELVRLTFAPWLYVNWTLFFWEPRQGKGA